MFDKHLLQYSKPGESGECELVVGLDFGTSASKVVVQAPELAGGQAYAIDFGDVAHSSMAYLLPTRLWVTSKGTCSLAPGGGARLVNDIKLELFADGEQLDLHSTHGPTRQRLHPEAAAVAYLALLLRHTRKWFLETKRDVIGHFQSLKWALNLGVPSPCIEDNTENLRFRRVGKAAWMLSVQEDHITIGKAEDELRYLVEAPEYWERDDDGTTCDFDIIPEIAAGAVGYALSPLRREGVHLMVDVGASTVDVCSFLLDRRESDRYSLLTADVQQLGTIRLHHERIRAIQRLHEGQAQYLRDKHDPLTPISEDIEPYLLSRSQIVSGVQVAEKDLRRRLHFMLQRIVTDLKTRRAPNEAIWRGRLPVLLIGGGTKLPFFSSLAEELGEWMKSYAGNEGAVAVPLPVPNTLKSETAEYHRLAVAWGLSHRAPDVGDIIPADRIADLEPHRKRTWEDAFITKDQV
jgi:hypothetical protein